MKMTPRAEAINRAAGLKRSPEVERTLAMLFDNGSKVASFQSFRIPQSLNRPPVEPKPAAPTTPSSSTPEPTDQQR